MSKGMDQAAGLRRLLGNSSTKRLTFLSTLLPEQKNIILLNLAASLVQIGGEVTLIDASLCATGLATLSQRTTRYSLYDVVTQNMPEHQVVEEILPKIHLTTLSQKPLSTLTQETQHALSNTINRLNPDSNFCLVDCNLLQDNPFLLPEFVSSDVVMLASVAADSIKNITLQIKIVYQHLGKRTYYLLLIGASNQQAFVIQQNINQLISQQLPIKLVCLAGVPIDDDFLRAVELKRPVIDMFPKSKTSVALRHVATLVNNTRQVNLQTTTASPAEKT